MDARIYTNVSNKWASGGNQDQEILSMADFHTMHQVRIFFKYRVH